MKSTLLLFLIFVAFFGCDYEWRSIQACTRDRDCEGGQVCIDGSCKNISEVKEDSFSSTESMSESNNPDAGYREKTIDNRLQEERKSNEREAADRALIPESVSEDMQDCSIRIQLMYQDVVLEQFSATGDFLTRDAQRIHPSARTIVAVRTAEGKEGMQNCTGAPGELALLTGPSIRFRILNSTYKGAAIYCSNRKSEDHNFGWERSAECIR